MGSSQELESAIAELSIRGDVVWLAARLTSGRYDDVGSWPERIIIHIKFFRALMTAGCGNGIRVDLASHGKKGFARPRYVRRGVFLEWDIEAESASQYGVWNSFAIFALVPDRDGPWLWCWICESTEEEEYAEALFRWWEPQSFALARGSPLFPERISPLEER